MVVGSADQPAQTIGNGIAAAGESGGCDRQRRAGRDAAAPAGWRRDHPDRSAPARLQPRDPGHVVHPGRDPVGGLIAALAAADRRDWRRSGKAAYERFSAEAAAIAPGAEGLIFLPYLSGERTPHMDPLARGAFIGLSYYHEQGHLARAVMEGVAFALRQTLEISLELRRASRDAGRGGQRHGQPGLAANSRRRAGAAAAKESAQRASRDRRGDAGGGRASASTARSKKRRSRWRSTGRSPSRSRTSSAVQGALRGIQALYPRLREDFHTLSKLGKESDS